MVYHADYSNTKGLTKEETLQHILDSFETLKTKNWVTNLSNLSSLLWHSYHSLGIKVNWTGFYTIDESINNNNNELVLAPFQGKVACQTIKIGNGVCGTCAFTKLTQLVPNVEEFPGHIACDGDTKSEIVVPILKNNKIWGVIDLDCEELNGFDEIDQLYLEKLAESISKSL
ncbi:YKL069W [Candida pseudojiufengensis]|uniref:YKL069W n=1 Tax=Candida pseudojiufengensis TaxID=497109 RepID=UPI0022248E26|nr:YKL069W [Candida pseudojiufengensis]KAI5963199.1 YKL069W [Candida pseudojiufengensis]